MTVGMRDANDGGRPAGWIDVAGLVRRLPALRRHRIVRLLTRISPGSRYTLIPFQGTEVYGDLSDSGSRLTLFRGRYYPQFCEIAASLLEGGGDYFDVGANVGFTAFGLLPLVDRNLVRVHLFEANPHCCSLLRRSAAHHGLEAAVVEACVGDRSGTARLSVPQGDLEAAAVTAGEGVEVPVVTLDDYMARSGTDRIALLKIDIEGSEPLALRGSRRALERGAVEAIFSEVSESALSRQGHSSGEYLAFLRGHGFETFFVRDEDFDSGRPPRSQWGSLRIGRRWFRAAHALEAPPGCHTDVLGVHSSRTRSGQVEFSPTEGGDRP